MSWWPNLHAHMDSVCSGTRPNDKDRCAALVEAGVDLIIIDSSQVQSDKYLNLVACDSS